MDYGYVGLTIFLSFVAFGSFSWALRGHFETRGSIPHRMRLLGVFSLLSYICYIGSVFWRRSEMSLGTIIGLAGFISSSVIFWWAVVTTRRHRLNLAYTDADPDIVYANGPYAHVRHPFYLSYIIFWVSSALIIGMWQWLPAIILTFWYIQIANDEEARFRSSALSTDYEIYRAQTGMLLPRLIVM